MPSPTTYRKTIENKTVDLWTGKETIQRRTVRKGRTRWTGNQHRKKTHSVMPPTQILSEEVDEWCDQFSRVAGRYSYEGDPKWVFGGTPQIRIVEPSEKQRNETMADAMAAFSGNSGFAESLAETPSALRLISRRTRLIVSILHLAGMARFREASSLLKTATGYNVSNRSIKRLEKKFSEAKSYDSRRASSFWLEYSFGFAPLFQSIYDSVEVFNSSYTVRSKTQSRVQRKAGVYGAVGNQQVENLDRLGLSNPALLAWDLLPFSFVIDWFLPIGRILAWLGSRRGLVRAYGWISYERIRTESYGGYLYSKITTYTRLPVVPSVSYHLNSGPRSIGLWHAVTSVSLVNNLR